MTLPLSKEQIEAIQKAKRYLQRCEDRVTNAMHCGDDEFRAASKELRRAQIRLADLESQQ